MQRIRHYMDWNTNCIQYLAMKEVHATFLECFLKTAASFAKPDDGERTVRELLADVERELLFNVRPSVWRERGYAANLISSKFAERENQGLSARHFQLHIVYMPGKKGNGIEFIAV